MSQPPGFVDSQQSSHVCKLHKSLYGLKQAPRAWNERFTNFLPSLGFLTTFSDSSLFVKHVGNSVVILLLYVDDIIITGSATAAITDVIQALAQEFDIKDLGLLHYFLGIQITYHSTGLFLSQAKYITDLLHKTDMSLSKPCNTPCLPYTRLLKDDGKPFHNPALYRSVVGALQYLTFTRPDIAFSVHQVCQFMHCPMESHFLAMKRILRYLMTPPMLKMLQKIEMYVPFQFGGGYDVMMEPWPAQRMPAPIPRIAPATIAKAWCLWWL
ncbi:hypothetical protein ACFXTN_002248 [Malus domestica]